MNNWFSAYFHTYYSYLPKNDSKYQIVSRTRENLTKIRSEFLYTEDVMKSYDTVICKLYLRFLAIDIKELML